MLALSAMGGAGTRLAASIHRVVTNARNLVQFEDFVLDRGAYELRRGGAVSFRSSGFRSNCYACWSSAADSSSRARKFWSASGARASSSIARTASTPRSEKSGARLCDDPDAPRFVVTVPAKGYRFVAEIRAPKTS